MPFDTALSGIRAASSDLSVTGNNIANASTAGFKASRVEFGDVYATSVLGGGSNAIGSGVQIQDVAQRFTQGNVGFTENELDLAVNGNGFFVVQRDGEILYTRAGSFGLDNQGYITNNVNARLQGFSADSAGNVGGIQGDVQIQTSNLAPRQTTRVESLLNLDSTEPVLQSIGSTFTTDGNSIGVSQAGLQTATTTQLTGGNFTLPLANDFSTTPMGFDIQLSGASSGNNGTVSIDLDTAAGMPATINTFNDLRTLASVVNSQIFSPTGVGQTAIDAVATAVDLGGGNFRLDISALQTGEGSQIALSNQSANVAQVGLNPASASVAGIAAVSNGYPQQSVDVTDPNGDTITYTANQGATAAATASELNALQGVSATARTDLTLSNYVNSAGNLALTLNGVTLAANDLAGIETEINSLSNSILPGISAVLSATGTELQITSIVGDDLNISIDSIDDGDSVSVQGDSGAPAEVLEVDAASNGVSAGSFDSALNSIVVGGALTIALDEGYSMSNPVPQTALFQPLTPASFTSFVINEFDPADQSTFNSATSMTIYDSLGNTHVMTQYFVKQDYNPADSTSAPNHWKMFVQIDGRDVGDPDTTLAPPANTLPTRASYDVYFNENGSLNETLSSDVLISNWSPVSPDGQDNGALGPQNLLAGGTVVLPEPPTSSNFVIDINGTTQFGSAFSVNDVDQNGFTTGRLSGLLVDNSGVIFARFTNGESQVLGQVALADFTNQQGLQPSGNTMWAETFESGPPNVGTPGSAALGAIQSGALEDSNVDLSEQLVNLIIAQRNFQASAKTIETANAVTQTIINLR